MNTMHLASFPGPVRSSLAVQMRRACERGYHEATMHLVETWVNGRRLTNRFSYENEICYNNIVIMVNVNMNQT